MIRFRSQSPSTASAAAARWQIRSEQFRAASRIAPVGVAANLLTGLVIVIGLWNVVPRAHLVFWGVALVCALALGTVYSVVYGGRTLDASNRHWVIGGLGCFAAAGVVWGAGGGLLFPPQSLEHQFLFLLALTGLGAGAAMGLGSYLPAFYVYFPVSVLPIGIRLLLSNEPTQTLIGVMLMIYAVGLTGSAHVANKTLTRSLKLQYENADLARELAVQRDAAERANLAKSRFLAAASHDLRQPLHALGLFTTVIDEQAAPPKVRRVVGKINESVSALQRMFDVLLDVSRLDAGVMRPSLRHFYLRDLGTRLASDYAPEAEAKGLRFKCDAADIVVHSDPELLGQILRNLVANAVRYTEAGEIRVDTVVQDGAVRIRVTDTGIGISPDQQSTIFEEFYQLGNPERDRNKGLGLGLAIVDRVARLLGYPVIVESAPGRGSCFCVVVPLGDARAVATDPQTVPRVAGDLSGLRVVVIDDDIAARTALATLIAHWGCEVISTASEAEAVSATRSSGGAPNAIIADYRLRDGRDGVQAIARLRHEFDVTIPALIVTGDTAAERLRELKSGGHEIAHKPVPPANLRAFLGNVRAQRVAIGHAKDAPPSDQGRGVNHAG